MKLADSALAIVFFLALAGSADAAELVSFDAEFTVFEGKAFADLVLMADERVSEFEWRIPKDSTAVDVKNASFEVHDGGHDKVLRLFGIEGRQVRIQYATSTVLEKAESGSLFLFDVSGIDARLKDARAEGGASREAVSAAAAAAQILLQADLKIEAAESAFSASEFSKSFELANTARRLAEVAESVFLEEIESGVKADTALAIGGNAGAAADSGAEADAEEEAYAGAEAGIDVRI